MSDRTQTANAGSGPPTDAGLDGIGRQLFVLARVGLLPAKIVERQRSAADLGMLLDLASASADLREQAQALVDLVVRAAKTLGEGPLGQSVRQLYGTEPGERGLPYQRRHAGASYAWDSDIEIASYDRRYRRTCINALEHGILELKRQAAQQELQATLASGYLPPPADPMDDQPNLDFIRLSFSAESHIVGQARHPAFTDWRYRDVSLTGRQQYRRIFTQVEARLTLEPLDDSITVERPLGLNRFGYQIWLIKFRAMPERGQEIEWRVRKRFAFPQAEPVDKDWLSLAVSQPNYIATGKFTVNLGQAREVPERFARFISPKMTLPNLRGQTWPLPPPANLRQTTTFERLTPWHSHGIYWWWASIRRASSFTGPGRI